MPGRGMLARIGRALGWLIVLAAFCPGSAAAQGGVQLYFPFFEGNADAFSGYALTNLGPGPASLTILGFDNQGAPLSAPGAESVASQAQLAKLGREFFAGITTLDGWIQVSSDESQVASFFQFGNGLSGQQTQLDGGVAFSALSNTLVFTRILDGPRTFPNFGQAGPKPAQTILSIANPNDVAVTLTMDIFDAAGLPRAPQRKVVLGAQERLSQEVFALFNLTPDSNLDAEWVRVEVSGPGAVGFEVIQIEDGVLGLNAQTPGSATMLYSAQLASGNTAASGSIFTSLTLVNTAPDSRIVTITIFGNDGQELGVVNPFQLAPHQIFQKPVNELVAGLGSPTLSQLFTGSIEVKVDGGTGILGDVIFGDPGDTVTATPVLQDFAAALPLQTQLFTRAIFSQVANGQIGTQQMFTGLALFNPDAAATATVQVQVFDRFGTPVGPATPVVLGPKQRTSQLVEELVPASKNLIRGYIILDSDQPIVAQQLFGNSTQDYLSAVPPIILQ